LIKFVWHWEWNPDELELEVEMDEKFLKALKKYPDEFPKLGKSCMTERGKGFRIIEAENEEQLINLVAFWWPTENWKLVPYFHTPDIDAAIVRWKEEVY
jgi:hypothetical protein